MAGSGSAGAPRKRAPRPRKKAAATEAAKPAARGTTLKTSDRAQKKGMKALESKENQLKALELRKAGMSFPQIAEACGWGYASSAYRAVMRAIQDLSTENAEYLRRLEAARLDTMFAAAYPTAIQRGARGQFAAIDRCLAIMERRANMLGTDAPIRIQQAIVTEQQFMEAIEAVEAQADALEAGGWADAEDAEIIEEEEDADEGDM